MMLEERKLLCPYSCDDIKPKRYIYGSWTMHKDVEPLHGPCKHILCLISIICMPIQIFAYHR